MPRIRTEEYIFIAKKCFKYKQQSLDGGEKIEVFQYDFDEFLNLCRIPNFIPSLELKLMMYEAIIDEKKRKQLYELIF